MTGKKPSRIGDYEIISKLGQGAMGVVYRARSPDRGRVVALKVLYPRLARNRSFVQRFLRESHAASVLKHENIVEGIDVGEAGGLHYLAMEYVDGRTLHQALKEDGPFPEARALGVVRQIAAALEHASRFGILHRDVKPSNILLTREGIAKLADFGLAKALGEGDAGAGADDTLTQTGAAIGTPHYMSPEQARGEPADAGADVYALGATLFHILSGQPPYAGRTIPEVWHRCVHDPVPEIRSARPDVSEALARLVRGMMDKDPGRRISDPRKVAEIAGLLLEGHRDAALEQLPAEVAASAPPPAAAPAARVLSRGRRAPRTPRPRGARRAVAAAVLLAALPGGAFFLSRGAPESRPSARVRASRVADAPSQGGVPREGAPGAPSGSRLREAETYWKEHPEDLEGSLRRFREAEGESAEADRPRAREAIAALEKAARARGDAEAAREAAAAERLLAPVRAALDEGRIATARAALAAARDGIPASRADRLEALRLELDAKADAAARGIRERAAALAAKDDFAGAAAALGGLREVLPDPALADAEIRAVEEREREAQDATARRMASEAQTRERRSAEASWEAFWRVREALLWRDADGTARLREAEETLGRAAEELPAGVPRDALTGEQDDARTLAALLARARPRLARDLKGKTVAYLGLQGTVNRVWEDGYQIVVLSAGHWAELRRPYKDHGIRETLALYRTIQALSQGDGEPVEEGLCHIHAGEGADAERAFRLVRDEALRGRLLARLPGAAVLRSLAAAREEARKGRFEAAEARLQAAKDGGPGPEQGIVSVVAAEIAKLREVPPPPSPPRISEIRVATGRPADVVEGLAAGGRYHTLDFNGPGEQDYRVLGVPKGYEDVQWIRTPSGIEDVESHAEDWIRFRVDIPVELLVAYDDAAGDGVPDWLKGFRRTGDRIPASTVHPRRAGFAIHVEERPAGEIVLGGNHAAGYAGAAVAQYFVGVRRPGGVRPPAIVALTPLVPRDPPPGGSFEVRGCRSGTGKPYAAVPLARGTAAYVDRPLYTIADYPSDLEGGIVVQTGYNDGREVGLGVEFQTSRPVRVTLVYPPSAAAPEWLSSFAPKEGTIPLVRKAADKTTKTPMKLFHRDFPAGRIALPPSESRWMYFAVVKERPGP